MSKDNLMDGKKKQKIQITEPKNYKIMYSTIHNKNKDYLIY